MFKESSYRLVRQNIDKWNKELSKSSSQEVIKFFLEKFEDKIVFASSLGAEDQAITQIITTIDTIVKIITLDTGRLFQETYDLIQNTNSRYGIKIDIIFPDKDKVQKMVKEKGINLFYDSVENRKLCCRVRKIEPLRDVLSGMMAWISGIRRNQAVTRINDKLVEWDEENGLIKINPLIKWKDEEVWEYIRKNNIPYNFLHDKGYKSIGCLPCTRPVKSGEDSRSGRWWWENQGHKECGLHKR